MGMVEGYRPDGEELGNLEVELLVGFIVCYLIDFKCQRFLWRFLEKQIFEVDEVRSPTNGMHLQINSRRHDLIPLVDLLDEPATSWVGPDTTEGMDEGCAGSEVFLDGALLVIWRGLREMMDYGGDFRCCDPYLD